MNHEDDDEGFDATDDGDEEELTGDDEAALVQAQLDRLAESGWPTDG